LSWSRGFFPDVGVCRAKAAAFTTGRLLIFTLVHTQVCEPLPSFAAKKKDPPTQTVTVKLPAPPKLRQIQGDELVLHALDRLTFGPRPDEVEEVKAIGLDTWITQQLHPATIDDTAMEKCLEQFPAMRLSEEDLTRKYPPGSVIRQVENGKISAPLQSHLTTQSRADAASAPAIHLSSPDNISK
jgi:hypothetical protein